MIAQSDSKGGVANRTASEGEGQRAATVLAGKYMTFKLAAEEYGIQILKVREIIGLMHITRLPRTADYMRGVINLRGRVIPVVDLRLKFGMQGVEATDRTVIIVVQHTEESQDLTVGLLVDEVVEVLNIGASEIQPPPTLGDGSDTADFILGVGQRNNRVVFLLEIGTILTWDGADLQAAIASYRASTGAPLDPDEGEMGDRSPADGDV